MVSIVSLALSGVMAWQVYLNRESWFDSFLVIVPIIVGIVLGIPFAATLTYFIEDFRKSLSVDLKKKTIHIKKGKNEQQFIVKDIKECFYIHSRYEWNKGYDFFQDHKYLAFLLQNGKTYFITNLLVDPKVLINNFKLRPTVLPSSIPYLDRKIGSGIITGEKYQKKVDEFYELFSNKTKSELLDICSNPKIYEEYAIEAARKLLDEK
jgi:hypothetical protein